MKNLLQMMVTILLIFGIEEFGCGSQTPLRGTAPKPSWYSRASSKPKPDDNFNFSSDSSSPTRYSLLTDEQLCKALAEIDIPNERQSTQEFRELKNELSPSQKSCYSCLFGCCKNQT